MNGSSVMSRRSGVTAIWLSASAERSVPLRLGRRPVTLEGDPIIRIAAPIIARLDPQQLLVALALAGDGDAPDFLGRTVRKVDVDEDVARHAVGEHAADQVGSECQGSGPMRVLAGRGRIGLGQGEGGNAEHGALDGAGDGAGIGHVLGGVAAAIDAGQHQVGLAVGNDVPGADDHAIGRRALDGEVARPDLAQPQRIVERERMRYAGLVGLRCHHPDVVGQGAGDLLEHLEPARMHAVVIGDENAHRHPHSLAAIHLPRFTWRRST